MSDKNTTHDAVKDWARVREERERERRSRDSHKRKYGEDEIDLHDTNDVVDVENSLKKQRLMEEQLIQSQYPSKQIENTEEEEQEEEIDVGPRAKISLVQQTKLLRENEPAITEQEREAQKERSLLDSEFVRVPLVPVKQRATGLQFDTVDPSLIHSAQWKQPRMFDKMSQMDMEKMRKKYQIEVSGDDIPAPIPSFRCMKFPRPILKALRAKDIKKPTPIQIQALPVILSGRDLIGIAFTGSGKTLVFVLPMIMYALAEEIKLPILSKGEGPFGVIVCPSRELARQTYQVINHILDYIERDKSYPKLRCMLCMGGGTTSDNSGSLNSGVHMMVATPGRLLHLLSEKRISLHQCKYIALDEADHLIDVSFEEDIRAIFDYLPANVPRQTVLFSATMPEKIRRFAEQSLTRPIMVNVGRAGAANLDVVQEIEFVKQEAKMVYLLQCLQKTAPPVLIFCENKSDVDDIHEYLLLKGVEVCSIHGGKSQKERLEAIDLFRANEKDVLVATDVASKGLDFPDVQHVINYDMPREIENYVHRIGRTGRRGKTGLATTFVNTQQCSESILQDLKHLLLEAKQAVPQFLNMFGQNPQDSSFGYVVGGGGERSVCPYCGGLGHRIATCPKREREKNEQIRKTMSNTTDAAIGGDY
jgi:ATP-dependent RNA helicase DDX41